MKKELNRKGFTLAELLIVVAIIAILIAIAIPVFGKQLERSRDSASAANIRAAYAQAMVASLANSNDSLDTDVTIFSDATATSTLNRTYIGVSNVKIMSTDDTLGDLEDDLPVVIYNETNGADITVDSSFTKTSYYLPGPNTYQVIFWFRNDAKAVAFFTTNAKTKVEVTTTGAPKTFS